MKSLDSRWIDCFFSVLGPYQQIWRSGLREKMRCVVFRVVKKNMDFLDVSCIYFPSKTAPLNLAGTLSNKKWGDHHFRAVPSPQRKKPFWWFGTFFIFPYIVNNHPNWLSYFSEGLKPPWPTNSVILGEWIMVQEWHPLFECHRGFGRHMSPYHWAGWKQKYKNVLLSSQVLVTDCWPCNHQHYSMQTTQLYYIVSWS